MSSIGYFTELELLRKRITDLEKQLQDERQEFKEIYMRMKAESRYNVETSSNVSELQILREQNARLARENMLLLEQLHP